ncbi:MAG: YkgJ family cysteine cluster protein [Planctomycetaceae bacterium]
MPMSLATLPVVPNGLDDSQDFLCARCSRRQQTCCQQTDIVLTAGDVARVAAHVGHSDFIESRPAGSAEYADQDDDPTWRDATFRADGTRRVVKHRENGDCTFLGSTGCTLPGDVRPLICRLFPFEYTEAGLHAEPAAGCPRHLLPPGIDLFDTLGMKRSDAERWHQQLYDELRSDLT